MSDDDGDEDLGGASNTSTTTIGDGIRYPGIQWMLAELHEEFEDLDFPQYEEVLMRNRFLYVSQLVEDSERVRQQLQDLGFGVGVVNLLVTRAKRMMRRTQKLKQEY